ncbi:hypothetical protein RB195_020018 [Necator americanus]|uniref:Reverse transcriptase domain-containing protein n=1 Tax=Necator americanus TaxID=51031 RepID=A0ABR1CHS3_NECAM
MEKIIYEFYSDLFDSHVIPEVLLSEIRHAIMSARNLTAPGPDRIRPEQLKNLPPALINTLTRLFTRYLSECKVPKQWKTSKTVLLYKKGDPHDDWKVLDEGQPCEQAGFRKGFSTIDHIHTVSKLFEVSREYKMPLCLTFIDLKKAFDSVENEAVVEALDNQGIPTQYIKVLRELYSNFTTGISPFYKNIIIDVKRGVRQGDTISPKIFTATLENAMRKLEWDDMGVKVDGRQLHHLRFADDIVLITPSISQAERLLTEFDETCGCIGLQLNLQKTTFVRNGSVSDVPFMLSGRNISECTSYVYLGRELNMMNDLNAGQEEKSGLGSVQEHRGCSEEDQEHPASCSPLQHHRTSCFDLCFGNLGISQAGRKCENYDALRVPRETRNDWARGIGTNGRITGVRSISLKINGNQDHRRLFFGNVYNTTGYIFLNGYVYAEKCVCRSGPCCGKWEFKEFMDNGCYVYRNANEKILPSSDVGQSFFMAGAAT